MIVVIKTHRISTTAIQSTSRVFDNNFLFRSWKDSVLLKQARDIRWLVDTSGPLVLHEVVCFVVHDGQSLFVFLGYLVFLSSRQPSGKVFHCKVSVQIIQGRLADLQKGTKLTSQAPGRTI